MSNTTTSQQQQDDDVATRLAQDRPTIDAAIKSFLSLYTARSMTRGDVSNNNQEALQQARILLKAINNYTFPLLPDPSQDYKVTAQIWNGLIASNQKPSKYLGRCSLKLAWQHGLPDEISTNDSSSFMDEFGSLLLSYNPDIATKNNMDSDACLVWDADGGAAELSRRRSRRAERAKEQQAAETTAMIEELPDNDDEKEEATSATNEKEASTETN